MLKVATTQSRLSARQFLLHKADCQQGSSPSSSSQRCECRMHMYRKNPLIHVHITIRQFMIEHPTMRVTTSWTLFQYSAVKQRQRQQLDLYTNRSTCTCMCRSEFLRAGHSVATIVSKILPALARYQNINQIRVLKASSSGYL